MPCDEPRQDDTPFMESINKQIDFLFHDPADDLSHRPSHTSHASLTDFNEVIMGLIHHRESASFPTATFSSYPRDPDSSFLIMEDEDEDEASAAPPLVHLPSPPASPPRVTPAAEKEFVLQPVPEHMKYRKRKRLALGMEVQKLKVTPRTLAKCTGPSFCARYDFLADTHTPSFDEMNEEIASWDTVDANSEHFVSVDFDDDDDTSLSSFSSELPDSAFWTTPGSPRMTWGPSSALSAACARSAASPISPPAPLPSTLPSTLLPTANPEPSRPQGLTRLRAILPPHALKSFQCILAASEVLNTFGPEDMPAGGTFSGFFDENEWAWAFGGEVDEDRVEGCRVPWSKAGRVKNDKSPSQLFHDHHLSYAQVYQADVSLPDSPNSRAARALAEAAASQAHVDRMTRELEELLERAKKLEEEEGGCDGEGSSLWEWEMEEVEVEVEVEAARAESECLGLDDLDEQMERRKLVEDK